jgi:hypothetical protein
LLRIIVQRVVCLGDYLAKKIAGKNTSHSIAGITCKSKKYVYNGWTRYTLDPNIKETDRFKENKYLNLPCELMKLDWNIKKDNDFCLNTKKCIPDNTNISKVNDLCFSFSKGKRVLIYVKQAAYDVNMHSIETPEYVSFGKSPKNCEDGKVLNPKTGRCIKVKLPKAAKAADALQKKLVVDKPCPPGKVLNPKTGRCIKAKPQEKDCPPGKVRDPVSKRCIILATAKKRKLV